MAKVVLIKKPPKASLRHKEIRKPVVRNLRRHLDKHKDIRKPITANWSRKNKPRYKKHIRETVKRIEAKLEIIAEPARSADISVYRLLEAGTDVRYAHMTSDFVPKTTPNTLFSISGRGGLAYVSVAEPLEGIEARNWDTVANNALLPDFIRSVENGLAEGLRNIQGK